MFLRCLRLRSHPRREVMPMMKSAKNLRALDFQVTADDRPGWIPGTERLPLTGETVYCAGGEGTVVSIQGKTGDGSRLLQIRLEETKAPFFAASSNVLLKPR